jgi:hypothetical protein
VFVYFQRMIITQHASPIEYLDARRFEERYCLSRRTFFLWVAEGKLEAYRPSKRKTLVKRADVERVIEASRSVSDIDKVVDETMRELGVAQ